MSILSVPYCGEAPLPQDLAARWNFDPLPIALVLAALFAARLLGARAVPLLAGGAVILVLFVSPLCALSSSLFSVRVAHHLTLTAVAAPLLAAALPGRGGGLALWTAVHALVFWGWHAPPAYAFALASDAAYWTMQASLLASALMLWRAIGHAPLPSAVAALLATMVQMGLLGALLTFSATPLYAWHAATTQAWGFSPLEDQQLAGLVMWVPGAGLYLAAALRCASRWLGARERPLAA